MSPPTTPPRDLPVLEAVGLALGYGVRPVVEQLDLELYPGEIVALLGANGAGKSTTLLGLAGELRPLRGTVCLFGQPTKAPLHARSRLGLGYLMEGRSVVFGLSVADNLRLAGGETDRALDLFPELVPLRCRVAGTLSGGEQQILAFAAALSRDPRVLLVDELSLGLAPKVVDRLVEALAEVTAGGGAVLVVEQHVHMALAFSHRAYVLRRGEIVMSGDSPGLLGRIDEIEAAYLAG